MNKITYFIIAAALTTGLFLASDSFAQETTTAIDVAKVAPGKAKTPVTAANLPVYLDEDLASKHADFSRFVKSKVSALNRNHRLARSRMEIVKLPDGSYRARFHRIDGGSTVCKVRRSKSKTVPYVGIVSYKEQIFEAVASSREGCRTAQFIPVAVIPNRHIFSFKKGHWQ